MLITLAIIAASLLPKQNHLHHPSHEDLVGFWRGALVKDGSVLFVDLGVDVIDNELRGALSIEEWGLYDAPVPIRLNENWVETSLLGTPVRAHVDTASEEMIGRVNLGEIQATIHWKRSAFPPGRPFNTEEIEFSVGDVHLAGSLVTPTSKGPHPAVVLVTGRSYGPRTGMMPFAALFARHGIAALAFDGRGRGESTGDPVHVTARDRLDDVHSALEYLLEHPDIDPNRIGLLGESTGGWIVPMVAQENDVVTFLILTVGPAQNLVEQQAHVPRNRMLASGIDYTTDELEAAEDYQRRLTEHLIARGTIEDWRPEVEKVRNKRWARWVDLASSFESPAYAFYPNQPYDSTEALRNTTLPLLAIYGGDDFVVHPDDNVTLLEQLLNEAGNTDYEIHVFPGADHSVMLPAGAHGEGEFPQQYFRWMKPAPGYYQTLVTWIRLQTTGE